MEVQIIANTAYDYKTIVSSNSITRVDFDPEHNLELFCYNECSNSDDLFVKKCRGLVFNDGKLVLTGFPYTDEFNSSQTDEITKKIDNINEWSFYPSLEGTLIRVFYFKDKWFVSTNKKFNAFRSKWSSRKSFGELFVNGIEHECTLNSEFAKTIDTTRTLDSFTSLLNKENQYMFLVRNSRENRIVCDSYSATEHQVFHVGTFINNELCLEDTIPFFPKNDKLTFDSVLDMLKYVSSCSHKHTQGVIGFGKNNQQIKIYNSEYQNLYKVRGNIPSVKFRYLTVRMDRDMVNKMYQLYPESIETFESYEKTLFNIATTIHNLYCQKHIKKIYTVAPQDQFNIMKSCHAYYLTNPKNNVITLNVVIRFLNQTSPYVLNRMIKDFMFDKNKQDFQRPRSVPSSVNNSPAIVPMVSITSSPVLRPLA